MGQELRPSPDKCAAVMALFREGLTATETEASRRYNISRKAIRNVIFWSRRYCESQQLGRPRSISERSSQLIIRAPTSNHLTVGFHVQTWHFFALITSPQRSDLAKFFSVQLTDANILQNSTEKLNH